MLPAVEMAENAINSNATILPNIKLSVLQMDGKCRADEVMKSFINIYMGHDRVLGVLGPACSETVEPIAGKLHWFIFLCWKQMIAWVISLDKMEGPSICSQSGCTMDKGLF